MARCKYAAGGRVGGATIVCLVFTSLCGPSWGILEDSFLPVGTCDICELRFRFLVVGPARSQPYLIRTSTCHFLQMILLGSVVISPSQSVTLTEPTLSQVTHLCR
jgi:hypothetical protein